MYNFHIVTNECFCIRKKFLGLEEVLSLEKCQVL